jgi:hypothetical protein
MKHANNTLCLIYWRIFNNRYSLWYSLILGIKIDEKNVQTMKWKARDMLIQWSMPTKPYAWYIEEYSITDRACDIAWY